MRHPETTYDFTPIALPSSDDLEDAPATQNVLRRGAHGFYGLERRPAPSRRIEVEALRRVMQTGRGRS